MKNTILKPVIVLTAIAFLCATILTAVNYFWSMSEDDRFAYAVSSIIKADKFELVYDFENPSDEHKKSDEYKKLAAFNEQNGAELQYVSKVRVAVGGQHDGCYLIQSMGRGYKGAYVEMLTGFNKDGSILGTKLMDSDPVNNRMALIDWNKVSKSVKDKTNDNFTGSDLIANTGATRTLDGSATAINLAVKFYQSVILGVKEVPKVVTDSATLSALNKLFGLESAYAGEEIAEYIGYPITKPEVNIMGGKASLKRVYLADDTYLILEVAGSYGAYGSWTLLVLINNETDKVAAVSVIPNSTSYDVDYDEDDNYVDASPLNNADTLTRLFKGKAAADIEGLPQYLEGTTHATETNRGLKLTVAHALNSAESARQALNDFDTTEAQNE